MDSEHSERVLPVCDKWNFTTFRPDVPFIQSKETCLDFFMTDSQYTVDYDCGTVLIMYGDTLDGNSISTVVTGFNPYFLIALPEKWTQTECVKLKHSLNEEMKRFRKIEYDKHGCAVGRISTTSGKDLYNYDGKEEKIFLKIEVAQPSFVRDCRELLEYPLGRPEKHQGTMSAMESWWSSDKFPCPVSDPYENAEEYQGMPKFFDIYECNMDFTLRFQIDHNIPATGWVSVKQGQYVIVEGNSKKTWCQIELACDHSAITYSKNDTSIVPPIHAISLDIECLTVPGEGFPVARPKLMGKNNKPIFNAKGKEIYTDEPGNPIIQMGFYEVHGSRVRKGIHMIRTTTEIPGADLIYCYPDERSMLIGIVQHLKTSDPTFLVTYNGDNFDFPYIIDRMIVNKLEDYLDFGRLKGRAVTYKESGFNSSQFKNEKKTIDLHGRTSYDVCVWFKRETKLTSYTLNAVAQKFLGRTKMEMDYNEIPVLFNGSPKDRCRLAHYCIVDTILPWELCESRKILTNGIQMANISGVTMYNLLNRGQQMRIYAQILKILRNTEATPDPYGAPQRLKHQFYVPVQHQSKRVPEGKYKGAIVIDSQRGLHEAPVPTLDFSSLYPSLIVAYNLCYTTAILLSVAKSLNLLPNVQYFPIHDFELDASGKPFIIESESSELFLMSPDQAHEAIIERAKIPKENIKDVTKYADDTALFSCYEGRTKKAIVFDDLTRDLVESLGMKEGEHYTVEGGFLRVKHVKKGILPCLVESLMSKRKETRIKLEKESDHNIKSILDGRQLAFKLNSNSVYGMSGATKGVAPDRRIAASVTLKGRYHISCAKYLVETKFRKENGYPFDAIVIAGDTDSLILKMTNAVFPLLRSKEDPWVGKAVDPKDVSKSRELKHTFDMEIAREYGIEMAKAVTDDIGRYPMSLEFEKVFIRILISSKKRYAGNKLVSVKVDGKMVFDMYQSKFSATGLECVRRDSCTLVSETIGKVLNMIVMDGDLEGATRFVEDLVCHMKKGDINYSKLVITRGLSKKVDAYVNPPAHVKLAKKMAKRDPATAPQVGDRVKYIVVNGLKDTKTCDKAEDPLTAFENGILPDYEWYLENQLKKPLQRAFCWMEDGVGAGNKNDRSRIILEKMLGLSSVTEDIFEDDDRDFEQDSDTHGETQRKKIKSTSVDTFVIKNDNATQSTKKKILETKTDESHMDAENTNPESQSVSIFGKRKPDETRTQTVSKIPQKKQKVVQLWTGKNGEMEKSSDGLGSSRMMERFFGASKKVDVVTFKKHVKKPAPVRTTQAKVKDPTKKSTKLFVGEHTRVVRSLRNFHGMPKEFLDVTPQVIPKGKVGMDLHFESKTHCQSCGNHVETKTNAICSSCNPEHPACSSGIIDPCDQCSKKMESNGNALKNHLERLSMAEESVRKCLSKCEDCVKNNPARDFINCKNTDCSNIYDRKSAWNSVSREHFLKTLDW